MRSEVYQIIDEAREAIVFVFIIEDTIGDLSGLLKLHKTWLYRQRVRILKKVLCLFQGVLDTNSGGINKLERLDR